MKTFTCDQCGKEFPQAIEEEKYKDIHGNWYVFDLCAPCRNKYVNDIKEKPKKDFFDKLVKKRK